VFPSFSDAMLAGIAANAAELVLCASFKFLKSAVIMLGKEYSPTMSFCIGRVQ
jgi:hypothetical protein